MHKNWKNLGPLQPLGWRSLRQQLTLLFLECCRGDLRLGCVIGAFSLGREVGTVSFYYFYYLFLSVCVLATAIFIIGLCNCFSYCYFLLYFRVFVKILKRQKNIKIKERKEKEILALCSCIIVRLNNK